MWHTGWDRSRSEADSDLGRDRGTELLARIRPAWLDLTLLRRLAALAFAAFAALLAVRGESTGQHAPVVVAARDLTPGQILREADLRRTSLPADALPPGAITDPAPLIGATSAGAVHAGEILTDLRTVSPRLATAATGVPEARIVPMRLADNAIANILRAGDRVDVVAGEESGAGAGSGGLDHASAPRTLATDAAVVLVSGGSEPATSGRPRSGGGEHVVLLALDPEHASTVAAASLHTALTVVFH
ncbi:MAG: flagellar biosynthesis protein FlgA [Nocardia sp.]|nr:flagellar biosynthesis protein FlgA [Nocardia sp.]